MNRDKTVELYKIRKIFESILDVLGACTNSDKASGILLLTNIAFLGQGNPSRQRLAKKLPTGITIQILDFANRYD